MANSEDAKTKTTRTGRKPTKLARPGVRAGYDNWAASYDETPNPLVALDRIHTVAMLSPRPGERILDAGCGTGGNLGALVRARACPFGIDFSRGMLQVARRALGPIPLAQADLNQDLPVKSRSFDAVLCALVGEHLSEPARFFARAHDALAPSGRFVFSVFHPDVADAGAEANFVQDDVEYRLGAHRHRVGDYLTALADAGFAIVRTDERACDDALAARIPAARKYLGRPLLLAIEAHRQN